MYNELINSQIILKKRKRIFLEDTRYFVEDIRKKVIQDYGYEKVYKQGFNIKTPINLELQNLAAASLRKGLLEYDKRKGWRGPLDNRKDKNWYKNLDKFNLEKIIGWQIAIVKRIDKFETVIQTSNKENGIISYEDINSLICILRNKFKNQCFILQSKYGFLEKEFKNLNFNDKNIESGFKGDYSPLRNAAQGSCFFKSLI